MQHAAGLDNTPADTRAYLTFLAGGLADAARLERYAAEAPRIVEYFDRLGVALQEVAGLPDHISDCPRAPGPTAAPWKSSRSRALIWATGLIAWRTRPTCRAASPGARC